MSRTVSVITTFPPSKWDEYAKRMVEGFVWGWPENIDLTVYYEDSIPEDAPKSDRVKWIDIHQACPELVAFKEKHKNNPYANGHKIQIKKDHSCSRLCDSHINHIVYHMQPSTVLQT